MKYKKQDIKTVFLCPICGKAMTVGWVEKSLVACCRNKKCEAILVFGEPFVKGLKNDNN